MRNGRWNARCEFSLDLETEEALVACIEHLHIRSLDFICLFGRKIRDESHAFDVFIQRVGICTDVGIESEFREISRLEQDDDFNSNGCFLVAATPRFTAISRTNDGAVTLIPSVSS